ncbi:MAG: catechol 2,3-dioxygenase [Nevskiaceae bacterium]|nr:MAG: catechol 2,3-dioxygenase [Nevskiaceae bacterium]TBR72674.1 MAG: catechol 2,3-dioxygenase [Nevskiaceae bacterium]
MSMRGVLRLGEVGIRVMDVAAARRHYDEILGLHEVMEGPDGKIYYKAWDEQDYYSIVLNPSDRAGIDYCAFKVYDDATLTALESKIKAFGLDVRHIAAGAHPKSGRRLQFVLPTGHTMQLYAEKEQLGNTLGTLNPGVVPDDGVIRGTHINRLDHALLGGPNLDETTKLFTEVFDFDLSEKLIDHDSGASLAVFLTCSTKPHDIAFVLQPEPNRFHHASFLLESAHDVIKAADRLGKYRVPIDVGPNRHGITRGATIYFFDPSGNRNEVFAEGYVHYPDSPTLMWDTTAMGPAQFAQDNVPRQSFLEVFT